MKYINAFLASFLVLGVLYLGYGFVQLRTELLTVYDVEPKYTSSTENHDLEIVYFGSYACEFCRTFHPTLKDAMKKDGKTRYIPRMVSHGDTWEETLVAASYAAAEQGKFIEMHDLIFRAWPIQNREQLISYANTLNLDTKKFAKDLSDPQIIERVREDQMYFEAWKLDATPTLLVGKKSLYFPMRDGHVPSVQDILQKFEKGR